MPAQTVRIAQPTLYGGISKQPAHIRHQNQVEDAVNATFDIRHGLSKRPSSQFLASLAMTEDEDSRIHVIARDEDEEYIVVYGKKAGGAGTRIDIYEAANGLKATISDGSGGAVQTYLNSGTPTSDQIRMISIADYTLVVNTQVATGGTTSTDYNQKRSFPSYDRLIAYTPGVNAYLKVEGTATTTATYYQYTPSDSLTFAKMRTTLATDKHGRPDGVYDEKKNQPMGFNIAFTRQAMAVTGLAWNFAALTLTKTDAFASLELREDDHIRVGAGTSVAPGWYSIASKTNDHTIVLGEAINVVEDPANEDNNSNTQTTYIGNEYECLVHFRFSLDSMHDVAKEFQDALRFAGADNALITWIPLKAGQGFFEITSRYRGSTALIWENGSGKGTYAPTSANAYNLSATDRGFAYKNRTAGTGSLGTLKDTADVTTRWTQVAAPKATNAKLDPTKMPIQIVRTAYTGDGSTEAVFTTNQVSWSDRLTGDDKINPAPSIIDNGDKISDMSFHRNRLVLSGQENVVFSQAGDFFNFFLDNPKNVVDSDPIDLALSSEEVTLIDYMHPFRQTLMVFTKAGRQFELNAPEALTPSTASISPSTQYKTRSIRPKPLGHMIYFIGDQKDASILWEYYYDDSRVTNSAADATAHVFGLLPQGIRGLETSPNNDMVFVLPLDCAIMYVYQFHWVGNRKEQSAWGKWEFHSNYKIKDFGVIRNNLYILVADIPTIGDGNIWTLEKIPISRQVV
jgi:hypothetical protein